MDDHQIDYDERDHAVLHHALEDKYGPAIAQGLIDQIIKAEHGTGRANERAGP